MGGNTSTDTQDFDEKVEIGKEDGIKRFDYGATALAGFRFNSGFLLSAGYDYGLANIYFGNDGAVTKTRTFTVSAGFSF
ncbi:hypothetical protein ABDD95_06095 [Mucilaginibacter sp. PAMB04274]|uniref:hypothetical protein n=1 Tax=Mucilaginibacter sp. PAMB04274 TaxID=3138568 RepID=UPI0031F6B4C8